MKVLFFSYKPGLENRLFQGPSPTIEPFVEVNRILHTIIIIGIRRDFNL